MPQLLLHRADPVGVILGSKIRIRVELQHGERYLLPFVHFYHNLSTVCYKPNSQVPVSFIDYKQLALKRNIYHDHISEQVS